MLVGSLEHSLGSVGGFCAGSAPIVSHQRLSGSGYCFSASLPAYATCAALSALKVIDTEPERLLKLREATAAMHAAVDAHLAPLAHVTVDGDGDAPVVHLRLSPGATAALAPEKLDALLAAAAAAAARAPAGAAVQLMRHSAQAHVQAPRPSSLRMAAHAGCKRDAFDAACAAVAAALAKELKSLPAAFDDLAKAPAMITKPTHRRTPSGYSDGMASTDGSDLGAATGDDTDTASDGGGGGSFAKRGKGGGGGGGAAVVVSPGGEAPLVTTPLFAFMEAVRVLIRGYIQRQMEWHAFSLLPSLHKLRAARVGTIHAIFSTGHFLGSESFYFITIPALCWTVGSRAQVTDAAPPLVAPSTPHATPHFSPPNSPRPPRCR